MFRETRPLLRPTPLPLDQVTLLNLDPIKIGQPQNLDDIIEMRRDPQGHIPAGDPAGAIQRRGMHHDVRKFRWVCHAFRLLRARPIRTRKRRRAPDTGLSVSGARRGAVRWREAGRVRSFAPPDGVWGRGAPRDVERLAGTAAVATGPGCSFPQVEKEASVPLPPHWLALRRGPGPARAVPVTTPHPGRPARTGRRWGQSSRRAWTAFSTRRPYSGSAAWKCARFFSITSSRETWDRPPAMFATRRDRSSDDIRRYSSPAW